MNTLDLNSLFNRNEIAHEIKHILSVFDKECRNVEFKKGIYVYGAPGCGKTYFVQELLKQIGYDVVKYDAGDVRNKALIDTITCDNVSRHNILDMMNGRMRKIAIVMDEIDGMHKGDKGGISALVKLIRQKKTKKQKTEHITLNPVICIGNYYTDKKIKELIKVCHVFELPAPTDIQVAHVLRRLMPDLPFTTELSHQLVRYSQGDIRKIEFLHKLYCHNPGILSSDNIHRIFHTKFYNEDYGKIAKTLFDTHVPIERQADFMNDNDRTTVALLWHENIPDRLRGLQQTEALPFYLKLIDNICFADYVDRVTFQNQIWLFNELSTFIKTFHNNYLFHQQFMQHHTQEEREAMYAVNDVRFTKVLTKYSTEYSNQIFLYMLSQELDMDKKDIAAFFQELRFYFGADYLNKADGIADAEKVFADTNITKLDIKRMFRYMDKNTKRESAAKNRMGEIDILGAEDDEDDDGDAEDD